MIIKLYNSNKNVINEISLIKAIIDLNISNKKLQQIPLLHKRNHSNS
jgi:hypothetical protein